MSPTADSSFYKSDNTAAYHLPPIRRNNYTSAGEMPTSATPLGASLMESNLSLARQRSQLGSGPVRDAFPASASVSLPTSTTALDYLLHYHTTRGGEGSDRSARHFDSWERAFRSEGSLGVSGGRWNDPEMTKTLSATDADERRRTFGAKEHNHISRQFFHKEPCLYTHRMFQMAAKIFSVLKISNERDEEMKSMRKRRGLDVLDNDTIPDMEFKDMQEQIKTFELTFAALKFQVLLNEVLEKTGFFVENSNLRDVESLVCIILYEYQSRKFQRRTPFPDEDLDRTCLEVEEALLKVKTKILSVIAKERIKNNAPSIEYLLPEHIRNKDETKSKTPVYMWVNQFKTTIEEMTSQLKTDSFSELEDGVDISEESSKVFKLDEQCPDLIVCPPSFQFYFKESEYVKSGSLVLQDKSSCLAPQSVHYLVGMDQDVIHVNVGTGMTTAHLASLLRKKSPNCHVFGFGSDGPEKMKKAVKNMEFLGVKNVKLLWDRFLDVDPEEARFKNVKVILISANCSKSAITSPVQFIVSEGEDMKVLGELSKTESNPSHIGNLKLEHEQLLKHALKFPKVQAVVYTTRSRYEAENESVVTKVLEYINATSNSKRIPFKVTPPVLPFSGEEIDTGSSGVDGRYVRFLPSSKSNGCFVAIISREPQDPKEVARLAIARAKSKGMLGKNHPASDTNMEGENEIPPEGKRSTSPSKKLKGRHSSPESHGLKLKVASHKTAAAIGARLYQAGLLSKMQQAKLQPHKPEHVKVVKHPAPFRQRILKSSSYHLKLIPHDLVQFLLRIFQ
ncbi:putative methyltransferase NSUN7 isoform X1 [Biomphalaria glabrata]|uniref:Methyltransferase NSUN7 isoform X1 n=1 Tax=Biomphalaria glabrata TaxID=6526 RepID=A0A9W3B5F0_BIOGL|nr:putative methyltransferase NSUN7 isoform X1 [Biomphalaria glabrata]XP_055894720.1 putative methyltransferase NSUN7 isoform X1 [Biomphalaria glabrata]XP_055894721.1 putative methyltransferase NSUN7 isoform X1 [Biomphalaria glabrata]